MKNKIVTLLGLLLSSSAFAGGTATPVEETHSPRALEISGNVDVLVGYQHDDRNAAGLGAGGLTQGELGVVDAPNNDHFRFLVEQVEIDLGKDLGENIRLRADIDASDLTGSARRGANLFELEQAYVTVGLNGAGTVEWLVGKFNVPLGVESVDRNENIFSTFTPGNLYLSPDNVAGTKIYWAITDTWNLDVALLNSMNATITGNSALPTAFLRIGADWGEDGNESSVHIAGAAGPEHSAAVSGGSHNAHWDFLGTLWGQLALNSDWDLGFEGLYRQTNAIVAGGVNQKGLAGQLFLAWQATDLWQLGVRGASLWDVNPVSGAGDGIGSSTTSSTWGGFEGTAYSGSATANYRLAEQARVKFEYRFDFATTAGPAANADYHTGVAEFAYTF